MVGGEGGLWGEREEGVEKEYGRCGVVGFLVLLLLTHFLFCVRLFVLFIHLYLKVVIFLVLLVNTSAHVDPAWIRVVYRRLILHHCVRPCMVLITTR